MRTTFPASPAVLERPQHAERRALVRAVDAVDAETPALRLEAGEEILARLISGLRGRTGVLVRAHDLEPGALGHDVEKSPLALHGARGAFHVSKEHDTSPSLRAFRDHPLAREPPALVVVRRDEAHVVLAVEARVDDDDGDARAHRIRHRKPQRLVVRGSEDDARNTAAHEVLDLRDLGVAVVLPRGPFPDHLDAELLSGLDRAGVDRLPERMRGALGDHRDDDFLLQPRPRAATPPQAARRRYERQHLSWG